MSTKLWLMLSLGGMALGQTLPFDGGVAARVADGRGGVWAAGSTLSELLPVSPGAYQRKPRGVRCTLSSPMGFNTPVTCVTGWVARLDASTNAILALDSDGTVLVTGTAKLKIEGKEVYPRTPGVVRSPEPTSGSVMTVSRLNPNLDRLIDSTWLRGSSTASGESISLDAQGRIVLLGKTTSADFHGAIACGPERGARADPWNVALRLTPRLENIDRVLHLNELTKPQDLPFDSSVDCLYNAGDFSFERTFANGQAATLMGGPFRIDDEVRVGGILARELYRSEVQINFVVPGELGFRQDVDVTVGGVRARTITTRVTWPRWFWYYDEAGKLAYSGSSLINARRPDGSLATLENGFAPSEEVRAYATGIDLSQPLLLFADTFNRPHLILGASYVPGTFDSVVEIRFRNPGTTAMGLISGGVPSSSNPGIVLTR